MHKCMGKVFSHPGQPREWQPPRPKRKLAHALTSHLYINLLMVVVQEPWFPCLCWLACFIIASCAFALNSLIDGDTSIKLVSTTYKSCFFAKIPKAV